MGWGSGVNSEGRTVGYTHDAVCDYPDCEAEINLGLGYCCGELGGVYGEVGCGGYFCGEHLFYGAPEQMCEACLNEWDEANPEGEYREHEIYKESLLDIIMSRVRRHGR